MQNTYKTKSNILSTLGIFAAVVIVFMTSTSVAHGAYYYYQNSPSYSYSYSNPSYAYSYVEPAPVYSYSYSAPSTYSYYTNYSAPITASCSANANYGVTGSVVVWTVSVSGGNGYYTYSWSGSDGLFGANQSVSYIYNNPGVKTAYVSIYSNGQNTTAYCMNSVTISLGGNYVNSYNNIYPQSNIYAQSNNGLDIGCYADPNSINVNQPVTWNVEVTGGVAPYTYSWTGSDSLSGNQSSVVRYYSTTGEKSAVVTVTSADGLSGTRACSTTVRVHSAGYTGGSTGSNSSSVRTNTANTINTAVSNAANHVQNAANMTGSAIFSFDSIPWGWIAVLIILILFITVMYLLFNRQKI